MNLVRAISLGGAGGDLRGNDSTGVICHVQLCLLAIDWVLNILADNFLRDPLGLLIIFILQVFLLIIGLIFYLMSSANQAMKQGIHEKILRHHQVTIVMWTVYFSMLVWWYIWALKRSWPSAGEHFSFIFSGPPKSDLSSPSEIVIDDSTLATTQRINESVVETILGTTFKSVTSASGLAETLSLTTPAADWPSQPATISNPFDFISGSPGVARSSMQPKPNSTNVAKTSLILNEILKINSKTNSRNHVAASMLLSPKLLFQQQAFNSTLTSNRTMLGNSELEVVKFFWSPGFIAVYTIQRSISLLFYVAYILGTLHIINAHLIDDDDKEDIFRNSTNMSSSYDMNDLSSRRRSSSGIRNKNNNIGTKTSFMYDTATTHPFQTFTGREGFIESDSNIDMDDNFIRQLEDQDGDPFENEQYDYQYQIKKPGQGQRPVTANHARSHRDRRHPMPQLDSDETDENDNVSGIQRNIDVKNKPKHLKSKRNKARKSSVNKLEKTKGALRSMMMMPNIGSFPSNNNNTFMVGVGGSTKENGDYSNSNTNLNSEIYMTQSSITVSKAYSPENRNQNRNNVTTAIVTASTSIDTMCTGSGSTDELLVAEVFTRSSNNNNQNTNELVGIDGFMDNNDNDYTDTDESGDESRHRKQGNKFQRPRESTIRANLSHFSPKDEKAFTKRKM